MSNMSRPSLLGAIVTLLGASALAAASDASAMRPPLHANAHTRAHTETVLFALTGGRVGANPGGLVLLRDGTIIVSAQTGGTPCPQAPTGCGLIFKLTPTGNGYRQSIVYVFRGGKDGATPRNVVADAAGNLYGTTDLGGDSRNTSCPNGCGTVYMLSPTARGYHESTVYRFQGGVDGYLPSTGGVFVDAAGSIYGQTSLGGTACGCGTIYRLTPTTTGYQKATIHAFAGPPDDGAAPQSALSEGAHGVLYGTTSSGGSCAGGNCGVVFRAAPKGAGYRYQVIHAFGGPPADGFAPDFGVVVQPGGLLVGATNGGGTNHQGVIYRLRPTGNRYEILTLFNGINGANPRFLAPGGDGTIYGSSFSGGSVNEGLVYALHAGAETVLYPFSGATDGANPTAVVAGPGRAILGATLNGGDPACACGVVFRIAR
jgi:uncharacterized repeat protein (TIGR03803 family)